MVLPREKYTCYSETPIKEIIMTKENVIVGAVAVISAVVVVKSLRIIAARYNENKYVERMTAETERIIAAVNRTYIDIPEQGTNV